MRIVYLVFGSLAVLFGTGLFILVLLHIEQKGRLGLPFFITLIIVGFGMLRKGIQGFPQTEATRQWSHALRGALIGLTILATISFVLGLGMGMFGKPDPNLGDGPLKVLALGLVAAFLGVLILGLPVSIASGIIMWWLRRDRK